MTTTATIIEYVVLIVIVHHMWSSLIIHLLCNYSPIIYTIIHLEKETKQKYISGG